MIGFCFTLKQHSAWLALAGLIILMFAGSAYGEDQPPRYLAFQFFTASGGAQPVLLRTAKGSTHKNLRTEGSDWYYGNGQSTSIYSWTAFL